MCSSVDYVFGVIGVLALLVAALMGPCVGWCWSLRTIYVGLGVQGLLWESRSSRQHRLLTRASMQGRPFVGASQPGQGWQHIPLSCLQQQRGFFCWQQGTRTFTVPLKPFAFHQMLAGAGALAYFEESFLSIFFTRMRYPSMQFPTGLKSNKLRR